jgi:hypothetical protein
MVRKIVCLEENGKNGETFCHGKNASDEDGKNGENGEVRNFRENSSQMSMAKNVDK